MLSYPSELARIIEANPLLWYFYLALLVFSITWIPFMGSGVILAIFKSDKLPPFKSAFYGYINIWWKFMLSVVMLSALVYVIIYLEGLAEALLALCIVVLPISILYAHKDARYAGLISEILVIAVCIVVATFTLWQSWELRISMAISIGGITLVFAAIKGILYVKTKVEHTGAAITSIVCVLILIPIIGVIVWVSETTLPWERPDWFAYLTIPVMILMIVAFVPWIFIEMGYNSWGRRW